MATCTVSGTFLDSQGNAVSAATLRYNVDSPVLDANNNLIVPKEVTTTTATDGTWSLAILQNTSGTLTLDLAPSSVAAIVKYKFSLVIPSTATSTFASCWADQANFTGGTTSPLTFASIGGALVLSQLPPLAATDLWVGSGAGLAAPVAVSGDASLASTGALTVNTVGGSTAANIHSAEALANAAVSTNTVSTIVKRDGSGNFSAGTISAALSGNATTATTATNLSGSLSGDVTGTQGATVVSTVGTSIASDIHTAVVAANNATSNNTISTIVLRNSSGNFTAGTITAALTGTASGNTTYTANNHGVVISGSANAMTVLAPDASTTKVLTSGGVSADPGWSPIAVSGTNFANQSAGTYFSGPYSGSSAAPTFKAFQAPTIQKFTSASGTYTLPAGVLYIRVRMVGAGGGGGGGGTAGAGNGSGGGNTTFGTTLLVANGGTGGAWAGAPGTGGTASLGSGPIGLAVSGSGGGGYFGQGVSGDVGGTPAGGSSAFAGAGAGANFNGTGGTAATNSGSGGGGGGSGNAVAAFSGSGGGSGGFVDALITSPSASYAYAIGSAGTAGTAGTGGSAGGAGALGLIEVTEYYQ